MSITSKQIYNSVIYGAYEVINNKDNLNKINVFPVRDGDTGTNLASMMKTIINQTKFQNSIKDTFQAISEAALYGARGNSGIIFAQYLTGISEMISDVESITFEQLALAINKATSYAYEAIENPVEGTMISVMKEWGNALIDESKQKIPLKQAFSLAYDRLKIALEQTKQQLKILKKANVVDSGAKGFTLFIKGVLYYIKDKKIVDIDEINLDEIEDFNYEEEIQESNKRYCTECLLKGEKIDRNNIKNKLDNYGDCLIVAGNTKKCKIHIHTDKPIEIFKKLSVEGKIIYQKVEDMYKQANIMKNKKYNIALVTDSIADIPQEIIDKYQIHIVNLEILYKDMIYIDKLTIDAKSMLEISANDKELPTSSQPNYKQIENLFEYLETYYDSAIVMTVSSKLSGTYNGFLKVANKYNKSNFKISIINTKQNSGAQGLLVKKCAELIDQKMKHEQVVNKINEHLKNTKILVVVKNIDYMIKSGRLSITMGKIAKFVKLKPIVTLDKQGNGTLETIAFTEKQSNKKLIKYIKTILKKHEIEKYNIVHINNLYGAKKLSDNMLDVLGFAPEYIEETSAIVAVGAGEGAVAISYLVKE